MPLPIRRWLSQGAEVMEAELLAQADADWHCDVLIVGSGYGGAVAAARLAGGIEAHGRSSRVWVLERGQEHLPGSFPSRWAELPGQVRLSMQDGKPPRGVAEGLYDIRVGPDAAVLLGNGLGGGSLINAGVMVEPDEAVFDEHWPEALRCTGGQRPLAQAFASARAMLRPSKVAPSDLTPKFKALEALVRDPHSPKAPDLRAEVTINTGPAPQQPEHGDEGVPLAPCTRCGDCLTGCNIGAKGSLDTNYLWRAASHGARLFTGGTVRALRQRPDPKGVSAAGRCTGATPAAPCRAGSGWEHCSRDASSWPPGPWARPRSSPALPKPGCH
jgi:cholesterol oxidase